METTYKRSEILYRAILELDGSAFPDTFSSPKANAQCALSGRTFYATDDTLNFFRCRILATGQGIDRMFFGIVTSQPKEHREDPRRQFRAVIFDVFGKVVKDVRCSKAKAANYAMRISLLELDPLSYYPAVVRQKAERAMFNAGEALTLLDQL